jgi:hypothetical protein
MNVGRHDHITLSLLLGVLVHPLFVMPSSLNDDEVVRVQLLGDVAVEFAM